MGMPFIAQLTEGLGVPLALQVKTPFSPGARTRFLGGPLIQYGAAENRTGGERINHRARCPRRHLRMNQLWDGGRGRAKWQKEGASAPSDREVTAPFGQRAFHHWHTFDADADGVVHRAVPVPGGAAVVSRVRLRHVDDAQRLVEVRVERALGGELAAQFGPGDVGGGPGFKVGKGREALTLEQVATRGSWDWRNCRFFHLQALRNALDLQHLSSQYHLGTGGARWDEEGWLPLIHWGFCGHTHTCECTKKAVTMSSSEWGSLSFLALAMVLLWLHVVFLCASFCSCFLSPIKTKINLLQNWELINKDLISAPATHQRGIWEGKNTKSK